MRTTTVAEPSPKPGSFPIARVDLDEEIRRMRASPKSNGQLGKTLVHGQDIRLVLMIFDRGKTVSEHRATGSLTIQTLEGRVIVTLLGSSFDLGPGELLAIERDVPHAFVAIEDSAVLLTVCVRRA